MRGRIALFSLIIVCCLFLPFLSACLHTVPAEPVTLAPLEQDSRIDNEQISTLPPYTEEVTSAEPIAFAPDCFSTISDKDTLEQLVNLASYADTLDASVYYTSLDSNYSYVCGESRVFHAQSTIKAPYIFAVLSDAGDGLTDLLAETLYLKNGQICDGMGTVQNSPIGTPFTVGELITHALRESDNTAYRMLYDHFGAQAFNTLAETLGLSARMTVDPFCLCTASELGALFLAIVNSDSPASRLVIEHMQNTTTNFLIGAALPGVSIAHKYGLSTVMFDCHDCAIVYDEHPYLLVILSKYNPESQNPYGGFRSLAQKADAVHHILFRES